MTDAKLTVGSAIDLISNALETFEARERSTIVATVCTLLNITLPGAGAPAPRTGTGQAAEQSKVPQQSSLEPGIDIKTLKNKKLPATAREMACVVAYYLSEVEQQPTVTAADIEKYFKQAGFKLPSALEQILPDAKKAGYFELESRGVYKLNRVGYNAVVHNMPKREAD